MPGSFLNRRRTHPTDSGPSALPALPLSEEQERTLLRRVATQDRQAFETLYRQYAPRLYRYLSTLMPQPDRLDEVLDDVMVVWQNAARFDGRAKPATWILGIASHKALKARAKLPKQPVHLPPPAPEWSQATDPAELLKHQELHREVARALARLSPEQRAVVALTFQQGCSYQDIAIILGCPVNTVKTRLWHARHYLTQPLAGLCPSPPPEPQPDLPPTHHGSTA
jgi:RNA polymerase sigma factor (sigma-70 family)